MVDSDDYGIKLGGNRSKQNPAKSSKKNIFCFFVFMKKHHAVGEHGVVIGTT
jgi:hypothetical protein